MVKGNEPDELDVAAYHLREFAVYNVRKGIPNRAQGTL
jgi:hypothetical protein